MASTEIIQFSLTANEVRGMYISRYAPSVSHLQGGLLTGMMKIQTKLFLTICLWTVILVSCAETENEKGGGSGKECSDCGANASCNETRGQCECNPGFTGDGKTCKVDACICETYGDPHYTTFDSRSFQFQGQCKYNLVTLQYPAKPQCDFRVDVKNEHRDSFPSSILKYADTYFHDDKIRLGTANAITINGAAVVLPVIKDAYSLFVSGNFSKFRMECDNEVTFNGNDRLKVTVAGKFGPYLSGICGNCNGDMSDDCVDRDGVPIPLVHGRCPVVYFADSHKVYDEDNDMDKCSVTDVPHACVDKYKDKAASMDFCGMLNLTNQTSPLYQALLKDGLLNDEFVLETAKIVYDSCEYDVCNKLANMQDGTETACSAIELFHTALTHKHETYVVDYRILGICNVEKKPTACKVTNTFSACMTETTMTGSCEMTTELPNGCTISVVQQNEDTYMVLVKPPGQEIAARILTRKFKRNMFESKSCGTVMLGKRDEIKIETPTCGMCLEFYVKSFLPPPAQRGKPAEPGLCPAT